MNFTIDFKEKRCLDANASVGAKFQIFLPENLILFFSQNPSLNGLKVCKLLNQHLLLPMLNGVTWIIRFNMWGLSVLHWKEFVFINIVLLHWKEFVFIHNCLAEAELTRVRWKVILFIRYMCLLFHISKLFSEKFLAPTLAQGVSLFARHGRS